MCAGHASVGYEVVFPCREVECHAPVLVGEQVAGSFGACCHIVPVFVVHMECQAVDLRVECVGKLHVVVIDETQPEPFGAWIQIVVDYGVACGEGNPLHGCYCRADD